MSLGEHLALLGKMKRENVRIETSWPDD